MTNVTASIVVLFTLWVWNDFLLPSILLRSSDKKLLTTSIFHFLRVLYALGLQFSGLILVNNAYHNFLFVYAKVFRVRHCSRCSQGLRVLCEVLLMYQTISEAINSAKNPYFYVDVKNGTYNCGNKESYFSEHFLMTILHLMLEITKLCAI